MPVLVKFDNTTTCPQQAQIIQDASANNDGVMSKAQAIKLAKVQAPEPFVLWSSLGYQNGFTDGGAPGGVPESRVSGDSVQFSGAIAGPPGGKAAPTIVTILPENQRPSAVRFLSTVMFGGASPVFQSFFIDDAAGSFSGFPGAVIITDDVPAGGIGISLDGLTYLL